MHPVRVQVLPERVGRRDGVGSCGGTPAPGASPWRTAPWGKRLWNDQPAVSNLQLPAQMWWVESASASPFQSLQGRSERAAALAHPRAEGEQRDYEHFAEVKQGKLTASGRAAAASRPPVLPTACQHGRRTHRRAPLIPVRSTARRLRAGLSPASSTSTAFHLRVGSQRRNRSAAAGQHRGRR